MEKLESIIRLIQDNKGAPSRAPIAAETRFREDLGFDSFDLAEFTVHVEEVSFIFSSVMPKIVLIVILPFCLNTFYIFCYAVPLRCRPRLPALPAGPA